MLEALHEAAATFVAALQRQWRDMENARLAAPRPPLQTTDPLAALRLAMATGQGGWVSVCLLGGLAWQGSCWFLVPRIVSEGAANLRYYGNADARQTSMCCYSAKPFSTRAPPSPAWRVRARRRLAATSPPASPPPATAKNTNTRQARHPRKNENEPRGAMIVGPATGCGPEAARTLAARAGVLADARANPKDANDKTEDEGDDVAGAHLGLGALHAGQEDQHKGQQHLHEEVHLRVQKGGRGRY